jgi:hypothetical protein
MPDAETIVEHPKASPKMAMQRRREDANTHDNRTRADQARQRST